MEATAEPKKGEEGTGGGMVGETEKEVGVDLEGVEREVVGEVVVEEAVPEKEEAGGGSVVERAELGDRGADTVGTAGTAVQEKGVRAEAQAGMEVVAAAVDVEDSHVHMFPGTPQDCKDGEQHSVQHCSAAGVKAQRAGKGVFGTANAKTLEASVNATIVGYSISMANKLT
eukprot:gene9075-10753_t